MNKNIGAHHNNNKILIFNIVIDIHNSHVLMYTIIYPCIILFPHEYYICKYYNIYLCILY